MKLYLSLLLCILSTQMVMSCSKDDIYPDDNNGEYYTGNSSNKKPDIAITLFANNSKANQSSAAYGDYLFLIPDKRSHIHCYNLKKKELVCTKTLGAVNERTSGNYILYHCNQTSFGADFYDKNDPFPLLYISQRARSDTRCIVEVYRLLPQWDVTKAEYVSLDAQLVQTIYFPVQAYDNALGRINCAIDADNHFMYTYSYSTLSGAPESRLCRISCFNIPDIHQEDVILNDDAIIDSYKFNYNATNSQGGCIKDGKLYIGQGYPSAGYIYLNIIDLKQKKLIQRVDLLNQYGVTWEPEGCFFYNGNLMMSTGANIWQLQSDFFNK